MKGENIMNKTNPSRSRRLMGIVLLFALMAMFTLSVNAQERTKAQKGEIYDFADNSKYEIATSIPLKTDKTAGTLNISGDFTTSYNEKETRYDVIKDNLTISYMFDKSILEKPNSEWHMCEDGTSMVNGIELGGPIKNGAIIIQTSLDKKKWVTDLIKTNIFTGEYDSSKALRNTKDIQLINGCYYRITIAYRQERVTGVTQIGLVTWEDKSYKKTAEVYEFYVENSKEKALSDDNGSPRKELGVKTCVKTDTGFSEQIAIDINNPHYGWNLGTFSINGYTRETSENGTPLFLKNAGDKVTLWFNLLKDIDNLDGEGNYFIAEDKNGSDQYFEVPKTNLKRGALIVRFTDHEGVKHDPVIYTNFLAADATTGANTKVVIFEEGDYEVALDYTIGEKPIFAPEHDYRVFFKFSIRNGNTMFFPFDLSTGAELRDKAIASEGFTIDMAKSRYLDINVKRTAISSKGNIHTEDIRFNGPAKDGAKYTDEGIYTVDVTNRYTEEHTVKTFYVGTDSFMKAMAKSGKTIAELDEFLSQGYIIDENGSLVAPPEPEPAEDPKSISPNKTNKITATSSQVEHSSTIKAADKNEGSSLKTDISSLNETTDKSSVPTRYKGFMSILLVCGVIGSVMYRKKKSGSSMETSESADTDPRKDDQESE